MGTPEPAFCFGRMLQVMLQEKYPQVNFEVINAGMTAINSHVVLEIAKDFAQHQPDLFVVYLGNNEVVGPYGAGTVLTPLSENLSLIRAGIALKATRLGQLVSHLSESIGKTNTPQVWRGMEMFLEKQVRADDPDLEFVYSHFERNLQDIIRTVRKEGAEIIICTPGSNLKDSAPFGSLHRADLGKSKKQKWDEIYRQAVAFEQSGNYAEAIERYLSTAQIDNTFADLQFRLGRCYWAMGEYEKAKQRYVQARHFDTLRFRPDTRIDEIIRSAAADRAPEGVYLVDTVKDLEKNSPHETTGNELFYEHVHLNFKGNYLVARAVFEQAERIFPEWIKKLGVEGAEPASEADCARHLVYTDWNRCLIDRTLIYKYLEKPPFTNQLDHDRQIARLSQQLKTQFSPEDYQKYDELYRKAIKRMPLDWLLRSRYAELLSLGLKDYHGALEQFLFISKCFPHYYNVYTGLGSVYMNVGNFEAAASNFLKALELNPVNVLSNYQLGYTYQQLGRDDEAMEYYSKVIGLRPEYINASKELGFLQYKHGRVNEAIRTYRRGLHFTPRSADLHYNLGVIFIKEGRNNEAVKELRIVLELEPDSARSNAIRRQLKTIVGIGSQ